MNQDSTDEAKWIGYSKGVAYPVYRLGKYENTGWCYIEGSTILCCCLFEKIEKNLNPKNNKP